MSAATALAELAASICGARACWCRCIEAPDHRPPHRCTCGGSWRGTYGEADFEPVVWPLPTDPNEGLV